MAIRSQKPSRIVAILAPCSVLVLFEAKIVVEKYMSAK